MKEKNIVLGSILKCLVLQVGVDNWHSFFSPELLNIANRSMLDVSSAHNNSKYYYLLRVNAQL